MPGGTIEECLATIGVGSGLRTCSNLTEEWAFIKKSYFKSAIKHHPDKGGDAAVFRDVQAAFEVLRELFDNSAVHSFAAEGAQATANAYKASKSDLKSASVPSWEYYAEAAKEVYATYKVELARSARSRCQKTKTFIEKGQVRIGFMLESGGYGLWVHLNSWRVPSKVWLGLPDPAKTRDARKFEGSLKRMGEVTLAGVKELKAAERKKLVRYVMDKTHWTFGGAVDKVRKKPKQVESASKGSSSSSQQSTSLVVAAPEKKQFVVPVPGKGAPSGSLAGKTFVITGIFPEVGGGAGFKLGKDRVKKMIESFGGKVSSSISDRTDVLVVGKKPGASKVSKARSGKKISMLSVHDIKTGIERGSIEGPRKKMEIKDFATGFQKRRGGPNGQAPKRALADKTTARKKRAITVA